MRPAPSRRSLEQRDRKVGHHSPERKAPTFGRESHFQGLAGQHVDEAGSEIVRDRQAGAPPVIRADGRVVDPPLGEVTWDNCQRGPAVGDARECTDVLSERSLCLQRPVCSAFEEERPRAPEGQCLSSQIKLDPPILAGLDQPPTEPYRILGAVDLLYEILEQSPP